MWQVRGGAREGEEGGRTGGEGGAPTNTPHDCLAAPATARLAREAQAAAQGTGRETAGGQRPAKGRLSARPRPDGGRAGRP
jgi:hypothetical protein